MAIDKGAKNDVRQRRQFQDLDSQVSGGTSAATSASLFFKAGGGSRAAQQQAAATVGASQSVMRERGQAGLAKKSDITQVLSRSWMGI